jgi:hypothetical protein
MAAVKMAIIKVIATKLISGMLSTWRITPAVVIIKRAAEGKTRRRANGIISRETSVAAKRVDRSGAKPNRRVKRRKPTLLATT